MFPNTEGNKMETHNPFIWATEPLMRGLDEKSVFTASYHGVLSVQVFMACYYFNI